MNDSCSLFHTQKVTVLHPLHTKVCHCLLRIDDMKSTSIEYPQKLLINRLQPTLLIKNINEGFLALVAEVF